MSLNPPTRVSVLLNDVGNHSVSTIARIVSDDLTVVQVLDRFGLTPLPRIPDSLEEALFGIPAPPRRDALRYLLSALWSIPSVEAGVGAGSIQILKTVLADFSSVIDVRLEPARATALWIHRLIILRYGWQPCFFRASGIAAGLRSAGFDAQIALAHAKFLSAGSPGPMHAWVEVAGTPILDSPRVTSRYSPLLRFPGASE
jgi:Transglutaminase-like superfamily